MIHKPCSLKASKRIHRVGVGIIIINPYGDVIPMYYHLIFYYTNNIAKYEALILGLKVAIILNVKIINVF